jgi:hypothetical protein
MRSKLQVLYRESRVNPAVIKFFVTGTVNGVAVRAKSHEIHTGLHFVNRVDLIGLGFIERHTNVVRAEGGRATYAATRAVNEAILEQVRLVTWRHDGNIYPTSLSRADFTSFEEV